MKKKEIWDKLTNIFDIYGDVADPLAADNIQIAWPVLIDFIREHVPKQKSKIIDYGCGTGGFCNKLHKLGYNIAGIDFSDEMIAIARNNSPKDISYYIGDHQNLEHSYHMITSIMTLQFIHNIDQCLLSLCNHTNMVLLVVFNPRWVQECVSQDVGLFSTCNGKEFMNLDGSEIPVFNRTLEEYVNLFEDIGFKKTLETYPEFTESFVSRYDWRLPWNVPEFMILGFQKDN